MALIGQEGHVTQRFFGLPLVPCSYAPPLRHHVTGGNAFWRRNPEDASQLRWAIWKIKSLPVSDQEN